MNRQEIGKEVQELYDRTTTRESAIIALTRWHITKQIELLEQVKGDYIEINTPNMDYLAVETYDIDTHITNLKKELE